MTIGAKTSSAVIVCACPLTSAVTEAANASTQAKLDNMPTRPRHVRVRPRIVPARKAAANVATT